MIHIYCGDGKGKSTAAAGVALRSIHARIPVYYLSFMKDGTSGEVKIFEQIGEEHPEYSVTVLKPQRFYGFTFRMSDEQKEDMRAQYLQMLKSVEKCLCEQMENPHAAEKAETQQDAPQVVVILDEVLHAVRQNLLSEKALTDFLDRRSSLQEIILTGWEPSEELLRRADYVSEIRKVKHPYDRGIMAREGVEY